MKVQSKHPTYENKDYLSNIMKGSVSKWQDIQDQLLRKVEDLVSVH